MKIPTGCYVLYQPKYKTPSVFDLHERGMFRTKPFVTSDRGARLLINKNLQISIQYLFLTEKQTVKDGVTYACICEHGIIPLNSDLKLNPEERLSAQEFQDEITRVYEEWYKSYIPLQKDGTPDREELKKKLSASFSERKKAEREELKHKNSQWVEPMIPRMLFDFTHGLYERVGASLYSDYKARGGDDTEQNLLRKIQLFNSVYDTGNPESLSKPDGSKWGSEDEIWDCWAAFAGSESEAERVCQTMDAVFRPIYKEFN